MITQHDETQFAVYDRQYDFEARDNMPYLVLTAVQFVCRNCSKGAYVDLSVVPVHHIEIKCGVCDVSLFTIPEEDFEHELVISDCVIW